MAARFSIIQINRKDGVPAEPAPFQKKKKETFEEAVERGYEESKEVYEQYLKDQEKKRQ